MNNFFYKKPFELINIVTNGSSRKITLGESISQNLELLIVTKYGEHRHSKDFGCKIWDLDFELIVSERLWEDMFRKSLLKAVEKYERRIYQVEAEIKISEVEKTFFEKKVTEIKKHVEIAVSGKIKTTGERFSFNTALFLSPLSNQ